ncbi:MAG: 3-deoxy-7-phosphoheptulonate synthase class II [Deltaproteobacteria bacterium]|nr:3-deoxy-7-phosphoheptulonate synthase class II [Deltaproteobacteria bacterium]
MYNDWTPCSWKKKALSQLPSYSDPEELQRVLAELSTLPPLVTSWEVETLSELLAQACRGECLLLQGGDCSEAFDDCESGIIVNKLKVILQMSLVLIHGSKRRVVRVGRFAGQYAKPRSSETETRGSVTLPSYRGDMVNRIAFSADDRNPDPRLLLEAYYRSALTLNFLRSLSDGGFADLFHPEYWDLGFVKKSPKAAEFERMVQSAKDSLQFMHIVAGTTSREINRVDIYSSHEALHLYYEQAQTRRPPRREHYYDLTTHFPWLGDRTRNLDGAHVEYLRGIRNPIGVKIGPTITPDELLALIDILNPDNRPGRLTVIHRLGHRKVATALPQLIETVERAEKVVLWCCDPMHGNLEITSSGLKTRSFDNILSELEQTLDIHKEMGTIFGGVHFELTGENVTECIGGAAGLTEADLVKQYESQVDPRLNYEQSLEMAMLIARKMAGD